MISAPLCLEEALKELIPQREPILMLDVLYRCVEQGCMTGLTVGEDNMFCEDAGLRAEGIIEHMAQSASAYMGYRSKMKGEGARIGYIGEVRDFHMERSVRAGSSLVTKVSIVSEAMGIVLVRATTMCGEDEIASCRMKITN